MYRIFLVEDDEGLKNHIKEFVQAYNYEVITVKDYRKIEDEFKQANAQLVILDINLPYCDGFYLCGAIRRISKVPIIITSARDTELEQIMGIELGADDYITKPFSLQFLLAKIKAALRRANDLNEEEKKVQAKGLILHEDSFKMDFNEKSIELSKNEFKLLKYLVENKDKILTREELLECLWDENTFVDDNTLTVNVTRVRNRLKELNIQDAIKTKRGVGYILDSQKIH